MVTRTRQHVAISTAVPYMNRLVSISGNNVAAADFIYLHSRYLPREKITTAWNTKCIEKHLRPFKHFYLEQLLLEKYANNHHKRASFTYYV